MTEQEWSEVQEYVGFEPTYPGIWMNKSKARYERWKSGPWGLTLFGWVPLDSPMDHRNYWVRQVGRA